MGKQNKIFALEGKVQHYQWGGFTYLPKLLSRSNEQQQPFAEYWLGAHVQGPSQIAGNGLLDGFLREHPEALGKVVRLKFGSLPYLLKILDVRDMLSIQLHPTKADAVAGFKQENEKGIPLTAAYRNYKDDNHKPELMAALGEFWLLHGFRAPASMINILQEQPELQFLLPVFKKGDYEAVYRLVMEMDVLEVKERLQPLLDRIIPLYQADRLSKASPDFWAARAALTFNQPGSIDRGIFSVYLLNLVRMDKGEGIFQDSGILHAYLEGQNVEIMANSDNVLRGGLTPKHIDVPELMKHVRFAPVVPSILKGETMNAYEKRYPTPAADFELHEIHLDKGDRYPLKASTVEILIVIEGEVNADSAGSPALAVHQGGSLLLTDGADIVLTSAKGALIYKATVPSA
ncbi:mannose-6-phosphate isomerase, class I [Flavihumibacter profundi]|uniref:mannose-6-phosphate isomerase, class I n=1 Tax=Flavihumibacter profundi TaxID=2716883 RepID=UPI001CC593B4|nr:mannose-6-phosphate isomerase, class I [Flavihumibacter profundi]MBZ5857018.1 mannose-6-phosphate isomerase, class I [Flavihumibacter profundi]